VVFVHGPGVGGFTQFKVIKKFEFEEYPKTKIQYMVPLTEFQEYDAEVPAQAGPLSSIPPTQLNEEQVPAKTEILLSQAVPQSDAVII
jgi:hypothetical protein